MHTSLRVLILLLLMQSISWAAPKNLKDASLVIIGRVEKHEVREEKLDDGQVRAIHTATIDVFKVDKAIVKRSKSVKPGNKIVIQWVQDFNIANPDGPKFDVTGNARIRAYLVPLCGRDGFLVIDHAQGIVKIGEQ